MNKDLFGNETEEKPTDVQRPFERLVSGRSSIVTNEDCMIVMARYPNKFFDIAIVDPPYGKGLDGTIGFATKKTKGFTFNRKEYKRHDWDSKIHDKDYFDELMRVSKNQIIWGANYFTKHLPPLENYIVWYKKGLSKDTKFNECELAYTTKGITRMYDIWWNGFGTINSGEERIHPTQKPVKLYEMILKDYTSVGQKILDTHLGSGSSRMGAWELGFDFTGCELDKEYFDKQEDRFKKFVSQDCLFPSR